jgi:hypothetical protein
MGQLSIPSAFRPHQQWFFNSQSVSWTPAPHHRAAPPIDIANPQDHQPRTASRIRRGSSPPELSTGRKRGPETGTALLAPDATEPGTRPQPPEKTPHGMDSMQDLTDRTIALLRKASDFAAAAHDHDLTEVEIDGRRMNTITLELELRTLAGKLERAARTGRARKPAHTG